MFTPKFLANKSITVHIADGHDENGELKIVQIEEFKARVETDNSIVYTKEGRKTTLKAKAFIFENVDNLSVEMEGKCIVEGSEYIIQSVAKMLNPDGSVNHFKLGLI